MALTHESALSLDAMFQFNARPQMHKRCLLCALDNFHPDATRCR